MRGFPDDHLSGRQQALGLTYLEIDVLSQMWCLNSGVTEWTRKEIEAEIETTS